MQSVGESDPMHPSLMEDLKAARSQAQVKPVQDPIAGTESFLERARKRVVCARQEVDNAREKLASRRQVGPRGRWRSSRGNRSALREEANGMPGSPLPTVPAELTRLQSFVGELRRERDELRAELVAQAATESRPRKSNKSLSTPSPDLADEMETLVDRAESAVRFSQSVPMNFT